MCAIFISVIRLTPVWSIHDWKIPELFGSREFTKKLKKLSESKSIKPNYLTFWSRLKEVSSLHLLKCDIFIGKLPHFVVRWRWPICQHFWNCLKKSCCRPILPRPVDVKRPMPLVLAVLPMQCRAKRPLRPEAVETQTMMTCLWPSKLFSGDKQGRTTFSTLQSLCINRRYFFLWTAPL